MSALSFLSVADAKLTNTVVGSVKFQLGLTMRELVTPTLVLMHSSHRELILILQRDRPIVWGNGQGYNTCLTHWPGISVRYSDLVRK